MYRTAPGEAARDEALHLYSEVAWLGPAQIKLHRGASGADPQDAVVTLSDLSETQRSNRFVQMIAMRALDSRESRKVTGAADLREALHA